ncbi:hypothetical protein SH1V18_16980 [Vallitalea longa]|uniref:Uncharacterized protein n=1 Tax=Vallitalea longa TaxID=2936439 RepID=A0A9W5YDH0_9FIRM|nr:hypothetical protein [Vallitalea longa]GKX29218.1 hypothetical protein SH1V18_16980 [Vallitalea longa]
MKKAIIWYSILTVASIVLTGDIIYLFTQNGIASNWGGLIIPSFLIGINVGRNNIHEYSTKFIKILAVAAGVSQLVLNIIKMGNLLVLTIILMPIFYSFVSYLFLKLGIKASKKIKFQIKNKKIYKWMIIGIIMLSVIVYSIRGMNSKIPLEEQSYIDTVLLQIDADTTRDDVMDILGKPSKSLGNKVDWNVIINGKRITISVYFSHGNATRINFDGGVGRFYYDQDL